MSTDPERDSCQRTLIFRLGICAGIASKLELRRLGDYLWTLGRTPTETYRISAAEAGFIAETVALLRNRWLAIEMPQRDGRARTAGEAELTSAEIEELRQALNAAAAPARALELLG